MFNLEMTEPEIDDFDQFWKLYPRKDDKKKARVKWKRLSNSNKTLAMIDIADRYDGVEKTFIPLPTTYINGERWFDSKAVKAMPRTNEEWEAAGKSLVPPLLPRVRESWPEFKDRISAAMRNHN